MPYRSHQGTFLQRTAGVVPLTGRPTFRPADFKHAQLTWLEANHCLAFANKYMPKAGMPSEAEWPGTEHLIPAYQLKLDEVVYRVFHDKMARGTREEQDLHTLRNTLGVLTEFDRKMYSYLRSYYGAHHLAGLHVIYNGHATGAMLQLFPMANALGMETGSYWRANYSGDRGVAPLLNGFLGQLADRPEHDFNLAAASTEQIIQELLGPGDVVVLNGGPKLAKLDLPGEIRQRIARGNIRFVIHNAADRVAMKALGDDIWAQNLAGAPPKHQEIAVIGNQLVHHANTGCEDYNERPIGECSVILLGHGMIGNSVRNALHGHGIPGEGVFIIDPSAEARRTARHDGQECGFAEIPPQARRERYGVIFVANNDHNGLVAHHLDRLPTRCVVVGANSGGIGVDVRGIMSQYNDVHRPVEYDAAHGLMAGENGLFGHLMCRDPKRPGIPKQIVFLNVRTDPDGEIRAYAPNLNDTWGQEALPTSGMLVAATCAVRQLTEPGVSAFPQHISDAVRISAWHNVAPQDSAPPGLF